MRISDWSSDVCSSDLRAFLALHPRRQPSPERGPPGGGGVSRTRRLRHAFVKTMPPRLEEGVLYVSLEHTVIMHLCACGCGNEVALPLSPTDWRLTYDGQSISVRPSIGSWSLPCRSHYFIDGGRVVWAGDWTDAEIAHGRALDRSR